ncbi:MAG TPA: polysaccharide deacetylase family protein [Burkholderiales bacterium]|nr:polysaccharide deacetylase family protein [Burkholderiales bacterium]
MTHVTSDPQLLCVHPEQFLEQLDVLKRYFKVVPLRALAERLERGDSVAGMTAVTFDDGYADNLLVAKPILERCEVPATMFVASGYVGGSHGFWWDELERILLGTTALPRTLRLQVGGQVFRWSLGDDADAPIENVMNWHTGMQWTPTLRHQAYRSLHSVLYALAPEQRELALDRLRQWAGLSGLAPPSHRTLTEDELIELSRSELVEIGGHTISHPALCTLPLSSQEAQIAGGKRWLEERVDRPVTSFAYPYGSLASYDSRTIDVVRAAGFRCACTTFADIVRPGDDLYQLPRLLVRDWDGEEFERQLSTHINHWHETT